MTPDELRHLDAEIHRRVFGGQVLGSLPCACPDGCWTIHPDSDPNGGFASLEPVYLRECKCEFIRAHCSHSEMWRIALGHFTNCMDVVPRYAADFAAAWQVAEAIRAKLPWCYVELLAMTGKRGEPKYSCRVAGIDDEFTINRAHFYEASVPVAICKAALLAIGATRADPHQDDPPLPPPASVLP